MPKVKPVVAPRPNRFEAKALQDAVLSAAPVAEPTTDQVAEALIESALPEHIQAARRRLDLLSDERKLEIAAHYEDARIPTLTIKEAYSLSSAMLNMLVKDLGIPMRGRGKLSSLTKGHFDMEPGGKFVWIVEDQVPPPVHKALENMLKLPAAPEPIASTVPPGRIHSPLPPAPTTVFVAQVSGLIEITSTDMIKAIEQLKDLFPDLRVTEIREV